MPPAQIRLFAISTCVHCKAVKKLLDQFEVAYEVVDVDLLDSDERTHVLEEVRRYNDQVSFPTMLIGEQVIIGNKSHKIKEALQALCGK